MSTLARILQAADFCQPGAEPLPGGASKEWGVKADLKPHQETGVAWLIDRYRAGVNAILGDEMGLGKTLESISLLLYLHSQKELQGPFLVLSPLSVTDNWVSELARFAPSLRTLRYTGDRKGREEHRKEIVEHIHKQPQAKQVDPALPFNVLVTTYELAILDAPFLSRFRWRYTIIDEAHMLKNADSVLYNTLLTKYMIPRRLLLTGSPVQNNLSELWALLHFCLPQVFPDLPSFLETFPPGGPSLGRLKTALGAFLLRRTKAELVKQGTLKLPPLAEVLLCPPLVDLQRDLYTSILKKDLTKLLSTDAAALPNIVVQLRKACSHPYLFEGVEPEPFQEGEHLVEASGKLLLLDALLKSLKEQNHRVLIYAQMARTLDILQDYLGYRKYSYERLDGSVRAEERFAAVRSFSAKKPQEDESFVFLLTTRAGGVGLNLTAADTVIFYEGDWNPQADLQALQRAHRIGQTKPVLAIRMLSQYTIEEVIFRRAQKKLQLTRDLIGRDEDEVGKAFSAAGSSANELREMIKTGLKRLASPSFVSSSAVEDLVSEALSLRTSEKAQPLSSVEREESEPENMYTYEGKDYSKRTPDSADGDAVLLMWKKETEAEGSKRGPTERKRAASAEEQESARERKRQKAEEQKKSLWAEIGYKSRALKAVEEDFPEPEEEHDVQYVSGDVTKPERKNSPGNAIIVSCVDSSGTWGHGGMFHALDNLSDSISSAYEAAGEAKDLHLGDLHLLPVPGDADVSGGGQGGSLFVALAVAQDFDRRRKNPRSGVKLEALESAFDKLAREALAKKASVHLPRLGDRAEWYGVERLLRKCFASRGIPTYVYFYKRS